MAPLDPEQSGSFGHLAVKGMEEGVAYLVTLVVGWVLSRLLVGKRLAALERTVEQQPAVTHQAITDALAEQEERIMERIEKITSEQSEVRQEVFGVRGHGGISARIDRMDQQLQGISRAVAGVDAKMQLLVKLQAGERDTP